MNWIENVNAFWNSLGSWKAVVATELGIVTTLSGALVSALVSWFVARRNVYVNAITAERSKWLDKIRQNVADHSAIVTSITALSVADGAGETSTLAAKGEKITELTRVESMIRLQLNPSGRIDGHIIRMLRNTDIFTPDALVLISELTDKMVLHFQFLLKAEWETVKWEAGGLLSRLLILLKAWKRSHAYTSFLEEDGRYDHILEQLTELRLLHQPAPDQRHDDRS